MEALGISALYAASIYQALRLRPLIEPWLRTNSTGLLFTASASIGDVQHRYGSELVSAHLFAVGIVGLLFVLTTLARRRIKSAIVAAILLGINIAIGYSYVKSLWPLTISSPVPYHVVAVSHALLVAWMIEDVRKVAAEASPSLLLWACRLSCLGVSDFGLLQLLGIVKVAQLCHRIFGSRV